MDAVVNFAAESHVDRSISDPGVFIRNNIQGVHNLLEAARRHNTQRFLQISTDEVYGELGEKRDSSPSKHPLHLHLPIHPRKPVRKSPRTSLASHTACIPASRDAPIIWSLSIPREKLIPVILSKALNDESLPIYGDGSNIRDWIHVFDHNRAALAVLEKGESGRVYNIAPAVEEQPPLDSFLLDIVGKPHSLITFVKDRPGHDWRYAIDSSRIQNELGWSPAFTFEEGIRQTVQWYLDNKDLVAASIGEKMNCIPTNVHGAYVIEPPEFGDERGFFFLQYMIQKIFRKRTMYFLHENELLSQCRKGTLRGMHYQPEPYQEVKFLRVLRGSVWDVALDIREGSPTFGQWHGVKLTADNRRLLYIPAGCAHGFQTLGVQYRSHVLMQQ